MRLYRAKSVPSDRLTFAQIGTTIGTTGIGTHAKVPTLQTDLSALRTEWHRLRQRGDWFVAGAVARDLTAGVIAPAQEQSRCEGQPAARSSSRARARVVALRTLANRAKR